MAGEEGFEPSNAGIKIRCLNQLGDSPVDPGTGPLRPAPAYVNRSSLRADVAPALARRIHSPPGVCRRAPRPPALQSRIPRRRTRPIRSFAPPGTGFSARPDTTPLQD